MFEADVHSRREAAGAYHFTDVVITCESALPELVAAESSVGEGIHIAVESELLPPSDTPRNWDHQWFDGSLVTLSVAKQGSAYLLRFAGGQQFVVNPVEQSVIAPEPLDADARHKLLDQVLPRLLNHRGWMMIHGSAVMTRHGAVVFIGQSGAGKSTLAALFHSSGHDLLTDDCVRIVVEGGVAHVVPTYQSLRLWPEASDHLMPHANSEPMSPMSSKRRFDLRDGVVRGHELHKLAAIFWLSPLDNASNPTIAEELPPSEAVRSLLEQCFRLDVHDSTTMARDFEGCADLAVAVPMFSLSRPRDLVRTCEVRRCVLDLLDRHYGSS